LIITEPSLRWRLTFLPRKDLAVFTLKASIFHHSISFVAILLQQRLQIGSLSPLIWM
jgi:hypothetical protein